MFSVLPARFVPGHWLIRCGRFGKRAVLPLQYAEKLERIVDRLAREGVFSGDERFEVLANFGDQCGVCCIVHGSSSIFAIEIDGTNVYRLIRA